MILTVEELNRRGACKEAVVFFERNFPNGLDLDKYEIIGDYNNWVQWLNRSLQTKYEYDNRGNKIKQIDPDGSSWQWKYDARGMLIEIGETILQIKLK